MAEKKKNVKTYKLGESVYVPFSRIVKTEPAEICELCTNEGRITIDADDVLPRARPRLNLTYWGWERNVDDIFRLPRTRSYYSDYPASFEIVCPLCRGGHGEAPRFKTEYSPKEGKVLAILTELDGEGKTFQKTVKIGDGDWELSVSPANAGDTFFLSLSDCEKRCVELSA